MNNLSLAIQLILSILVVCLVDFCRQYLVVPFIVSEATYPSKQRKRKRILFSQKTKFVKSRYLEQIIVNCNNTGYHELYQLNILGINTNCVISVRLIERFRFVQNYQIFLLNNKMNLSSNDQQNARLVQSNTQ
ncbi:Hypothetical_protein [Hexamita inflata]|uniref:Hypothetical_protein n=1 Tax=Hexamita inflata TaxID=28002 RepID=A0ABP1IAP3_9EUKA